VRGPRLMLVVYCLVIVVGIATALVLGLTHQ
jgi:hypothetical protein